MQVILITGMDDEEIHQEIADIGAEAFFFKPLKMPEFLNAVRKTIGLEPVENEPEPLIKLTKQNLDKKVTERIADLRGELGAISIMIIEKAGVISAETGIVPDTIYESHVYDLFWSHIDADYGMMVITNPVTQNNDLTWVLTTLDLAIQEVTQIIHGLTEKPAAKKKTTTEKASSTKIKAEDKSKKKTPVKAELPKKSEQGANGSEKTKSKSAPKKSKTAAKDRPETDQTEENEVHEFWKAASLESEFQQIDSADSLSFEQAQKLGFVPGGENNNS